MKEKIKRCSHGNCKTPISAKRKFCDKCRIQRNKDSMSLAQKKTKWKSRNTEEAERRKKKEADLRARGYAIPWESGNGYE